VPERDQMLNESPGAADAVADDGVGIDAGNGAVDEHELHTKPREPAQVLTRAVADRRDHDPVDAVRDHLVDHLALELEIGTGVAEDHAIAGAARDVLGPADDQREERVRDVGDDDGERSGALGREPTREPARDVAELGDRLLDA
jgi:hypothetical protein